MSVSPITHPTPAGVETPSFVNRFRRRMARLYNVVSEPSDSLRFLTERPHRRWFSRIAGLYRFIVASFITVILLVVAAPYAFWWTLFWIAAYWIYQMGKAALYRRAETAKDPAGEEGYKTEWLQFGRFVGLVAGVSAFLWYLYVNTDYLKRSDTSTHIGSGSLWLLLVLAVFIMSEHGHTKFMLLSIAVASAALTSLAFIATAPDQSPDVNALIEKLLWLWLLAFILHTMVRYIRDRYADLRLVQKMQAELVSIESRTKLLRTVVDRIASEFKYQHVNIFMRREDGLLRFEETSDPAAQEDRGCELREGQGIIGYVAQEHKSHMSNDVENDPHYYRYGRFSDTKAEMAVPIEVGGKVVGVLDIQSNRAGIFFKRDLEVMGILANQIGRMLDIIELRQTKEGIRESAHKVNRLIESLTHRLLTREDIVQAIKAELNADIVVLYERDPATGRVKALSYQGKLKNPEKLRWGTISPGSLVYSLMNSKADYFQDEAQIAAANHISAFKSAKYTDGYVTFEKREDIHARAIIHLLSAVECIGILFVNFRTPRSFTTEDKAMFRAVANLATLALQNAQSRRRDLDVQRAALARRLHNDFMATADGALKSISAVLKAGELTPIQEAKLENASEAIMELGAEMEYLKKTLEYSPTGNLCGDLGRLIDRAQTAWDISIVLDSDGGDAHLNSELHRVFFETVSEAIHNAARHGKARNMRVELRVGSRLATLVINDDGKGFNPRYTEPRGLRELEAIVESLGGAFSVESGDGQGTNITVKLPIHA